MTQRKVIERKVITCCATTSHNGRVLEGYVMLKHQGHAVAGLGHQVYCPQCNGIFPIVESTKSLFGYAPAVEGMRTACGARLIGLFDDLLIDDDSGITDLDPPKHETGDSPGGQKPLMDTAGGVSIAAFDTARRAEPVHVVIRMALCNDGTGNNFANSQWMHERCSPKAADLDKHPGVVEQLMALCRKGADRGGASYDGGETNVHRLRELYRRTDTLNEAVSKDGRLYVYRHAYIQGVGTRADHKDSIYSSAIGYGPTGVIARAEEAVLAAVEQIRQFLVRNKQARIVIDAIEIDLFGFSRGAAASRHLCHLINHGGDTSVMSKALHDAGLPLKPGWNGASKSDLRVCFVGLYESVAAMGIPNNEYNDPAKLFMADDCADKVVQLVGMDECRENFALNRVKPGRHVEIDVSGVHSDTGGGYPLLGWEQHILTKPIVSVEPLGDDYARHDDYAQRGAPKMLASFLARRAQESKAWELTVAQRREAFPALSSDWLIDPQLNPPPNENNCKIQLWYKVVANRDPLTRQRGQYYALQVTAALVSLRQVRGEYQRVTLRIMHALAQREGVPLDFIDDNDPAYTLPDDLKPIYEKLLAYALNDGKGDYPLSQQEREMLSRRYLHQSAHWDPVAWRPDYQDQSAGPIRATLPSTTAGPDVIFPMRPADQRKRLTFKQKKGR